ncbi:MAG: hypothetical protein LAP13_23670 [Acidobacteriia bacterium]|nr:hypothetical protein [Terriglobia bacterium]
MTVCIGAICAKDAAIVTVSDRMISMEYASSDAVAVKAERFLPLWMSLFSGNDISRVPMVVSRAKGGMPGKPNTVEAVMASFVDAFEAELRKKAEDDFGTLNRPLLIV